MPNPTINVPSTGSYVPSYNPSVGYGNPSMSMPTPNLTTRGVAQPQVPQVQVNANAPFGNAPAGQYIGGVAPGQGDGTRALPGFTPAYGGQANEPGNIDEYDEDEPSSSCNDNFSNPLCFFGVTSVPDDDEFRNRLLTATMTEGGFRRLVAMNVGLYLKMLNLPPGVKRNADMVNSWIMSGCTLWIRGAGGRDVPQVSLDQHVVEFLSEFDKDSRGVYTQEGALRKAAPDGMLTEQDFMDWYLICKYTDAIIPPEDNGYPVFKPDHTSAMAQVLRPQRPLYDTSVLRRTPRGQTFDQVIQLGVDCPDASVGCIAGDEDALATFPEFFVQVR